MSRASESDIWDMVSWFGSYLDQWCRRFLSQNQSSTPERWSFILGYNVLELATALDQKPRTCTEAEALRIEIGSALSQVIMDLIILAHTLGFTLSDLLGRAGNDFIRFQEERYGTTWYHELKRTLLNRAKTIGTKGNHGKVLDENTKEMTK